MNNQMDDAQNNLLRAMAAQLEEAEMKLLVHDRMASMMFDFFLSELENHNPNVKSELKQILTNVKIHLKHDFITCAAVEKMETIIG